MATAVIGEMTTLQVLFVDEMNNPLDVADPTVDVFYFDQDGNKQVLVDSAPMSEPAVPEPGRFIYVLDVPDTFRHGDVLYVEFSGTDTYTGMPVLADQTLDLVSLSASSGSMIARFVKGG